MASQLILLTALAGPTAQGVPEGPLENTMLGNNTCYR